MKKVLFVFWHGLGDNSSVTPALRKYKKLTGNYIGWAMLRRFKPARVMDSNPHINAIHWTSDAWNDHGRYSNGVEAVIKEGYNIGKEFGYDEVIPIHFDGNIHRIHRGARDMGVTLDPDELHPEFFYNEEEIAYYYDEIDIPDKYVFFHGKAGHWKKSWDYEWVKRYLKREGIDLPVVSPDFTWSDQHVPISFAMDVMKKATIRIIVDSSTYYLAHAMDIPMDLVYFKRGRRVYNQNRPVWDDPAPEKVIFRLEDIP